MIVAGTLGWASEKPLVYVVESSAGTWAENIGWLSEPEREQVWSERGFKVTRDEWSFSDSAMPIRTIFEITTEDVA